MSEEKIKSKNKLPIIITVIILILVIGIIGGYLGYQYIEENQSTGTEWGDTYFERLQEDIQKGEYSNIDNNTMEIAFIDLKEDSTPSMMVIYKESDKKKINIYRERKINTENSKYIINNSMTNEENKEYDIQYIYNTELKENRWYLTDTTVDSKMISYSDIQKYFDRTDKKDNFNNITASEEEINKNSSYDFNKDEMQQNQEISKFEETFIPVDNELVEKLYPRFTVTTDMTEKEIKSAMKENIAKYNPTNEEINNQIKTATETKITELENKKEQIKVAQEEKAKKEAEEKAKAEEEVAKKAQEGIQLGTHTIKYGTYKGKYGAEGDTLIIKADGTATLKTSNFQETYECSVGNHNFAQDSSSVSNEKALIFRKAGTGSSDGFELYVGNDGNLWNDPSCYVYTGN